MDVAVIGISPVGCTIASLLYDAGEDVTIIGPPEKLARINEGGITVRQVWDGHMSTSRVKARASLDHTPDVIVFATRTQETAAAAEAAAPYADGAAIATVQYGTKIEQIVSKYLPRDNIVTCVLTMGATCYTPGDVTLNFKGHMVVGRAYAATEETVDLVLGLMSKVFLTHNGKKIAHFNCTRLLLNLPYCIPAIIGEKVQKAFMDSEVAEVAVRLLAEGIQVIEDAEVHIEPLPDFAEGALKALLSVPLAEGAALFSAMTMNMSRVPCEGPVLGSIEQGELTEIDYLNGEVVKIAGILGHPTPLNSLMVELVHRVEETKRFFTRDEFLRLVGERV
ncbi:MAG: ketopantoate reductase family protein [Nitrospirae bacterium]|nr:ketopantoate reductase family protein [Nitrospirota bacterium]